MKVCFAILKMRKEKNALALSQCLMVLKELQLLNASLKVILLLKHELHALETP